MLASIDVFLPKPVDGFIRNVCTSMSKGTKTQENILPGVWFSYI
jgi:hypothetical protein